MNDEFVESDDRIECKHCTVYMLWFVCFQNLLAWQRLKLYDSLCECICVYMRNERGCVPCLTFVYYLF